MARSLLEAYEQEIAAPAATAAEPEPAKAKTSRARRSLLEAYEEEVKGPPKEPEVPQEGPPSPTLGQQIGQWWGGLTEGWARSAGEIAGGFSGEAFKRAGETVGLPTIREHFEQRPARIAMESQPPDIVSQGVLPKRPIPEKEEQVAEIGGEGELTAASSPEAIRRHLGRVERGEASGGGPLMAEAGKATARGMLRIAESVGGTGPHALGTLMGPAEWRVADEVSRLRFGKDFAATRDQESVDVLDEVQRITGWRAPIQERPALWEAGSEALKKGGEAVSTAMEREIGQQATAFPEVVNADIIANPAVLANLAWWFNQVPENLPSLGVSLAAAGPFGVVARVAGQSLRLSPSALTALIHGAKTAGAAGTGGYLEGASTYQDLLKRGETGQDALVGLIEMGIWSGAVNAPFLSRVIPHEGRRRLSKGVQVPLRGEPGRRLAGDIGTEAAGEGLEPLGEDVIKGDPVGTSLSEAASGAVIGGALGGIAGAGTARRPTARVTFVGYDQTISPPMPMFAMASGTLVTGQELVNEGFGLPKYPKAPKGGGYAEGLEPEEEQQKEQAKRAKDAQKAADEDQAAKEEAGKAFEDAAGQAAEEQDGWAQFWQGREQAGDTAQQRPLIPPTPEEVTRAADIFERSFFAFPEGTEGLDAWRTQLDERRAMIARYEDDLQDRPDDDPELVRIRAAGQALKDLDEASEEDPEGFEAMADIAAMVDRSARQAADGFTGVEDPDVLEVWQDNLEQSIDAIRPYAEARDSAGARVAKIVLDRATELQERVLSGFRTAAPEGEPGEAPAGPQEPQAEPEPTPEGEPTAPAPEPAPEPTTAAPKFGDKDEAERARQAIRDKLKQKKGAPAPETPAAPEAGGKTVPRGTGAAPAPPVTPPVTPPAPSPRPTPAPAPPAAPRPKAPTPGPTKPPAPPAGKFGGQGDADAARQAIRDKLKAKKPTAGLMAAETGPQVDVETLGSVFQLGGIVHEGGASAFSAWAAEMDREITELGVDPALVAPYHRAIFDLVETALTGPLDVADLRSLLVYGGTLLESTPDRAAWEAAMVEGLDESVQPYLDPLYRIARTVIEGGTDEGTTGAPGPVPPRPGDEGAPEEVQPPGVPPTQEDGAPGDRAGGEGGPADRPDAGGAGQGDAVPGGQGDGGPGGVPAGGGPQPGPDATGAEPRVPQTDHASPATDIVFTDDLVALGRGPAKRWADNLAAIRLLKQIELDARIATPAEQRELAKFVGWGGLMANFGRGDKRNELLGILTPEEFREAEKSSTTAFYTEPRVARAVWRLAERLGFTGGLVLEPAAGTGIFPGSQPAPGLSRRVMVERDAISARIMRQLFPHSRVHHLPFEDFIAPDNFYDLAISNVPFSERTVRDKSHDRRYQRAGLNSTTHDFFFAKSLDKVRPGGLVMFITGIGTMDKLGSRTRQWLAERADLVGAIQLPMETFARFGTGTASHLIVLRKREAPITPAQARGLPWVAEQAAIDIPGDSLKAEYGSPKVNVYWPGHPEHVVGTWRRDRGFAGRRAVTSTATPTDAWAGIEDAVETFPEGVMGARQSPATEEEAPRNYELLLPPAGAFPKPGGFAVVDGKIGRNLGENKNGEPALTPQDLPPLEVERMTDLIALRDQVNEVLRQNKSGTDEELAGAQAELERAYDAFVAKWTTPERPATKTAAAQPAVPGYLTNREVTKLYGRDPDYYRLRSLERVDPKTRVVSKAPIFFQRVAPNPDINAPAATLHEAMFRVYAVTGRLDWPYMARIYPGIDAQPDEIPALLVEGVPPSEQLGPHRYRVPSTPERIQRALEREHLIYLNPETGTFEEATRYLSGHVRSKLAAAKAALELATDERQRESFDRSVKALEAALPEDRTPENIKVILGNTWVEVEDVTKFANELFGLPKGDSLTLTYTGVTGKWTVHYKGKTVIHTGEAHQWGTRHVRPIKLLEKTLNLKRQPMITYKVNGEWVKDPEETRLARLLQEAMKQRFSDWLWEEEARSTKYQTIFNDLFNSYVDFEPSGAHLMFPGMSEAWRDMMRPAQKDAVWRIVVAGNTLLTHAVGHGKSPILVASAMELKRLGLATKVMMVVPNSTVPQMGEGIMAMYPGANLLQINPGDMSAANREEFMATVAAGQWDIVLVPQSSFNLFNMSAQAEVAYIQERIDELRIALAARMNMPGVDPKKDPSIRDILNAIDALEAKLTKLMERIRERGSKGMTFEELGVDGLIIDEAHDYKNLKFATKMAGVPGVPGGDSPQRALQLHMKTRYLSEMNGERNVIFATGTPVANSLTEAYVMQTYLMPDRLKQMGVGSFDAWASTFARVTVEPEFSLMGEFEQKARLREFINLPQMIAGFRQVATRQLSPEEAGIKRPILRGYREIPEDLVGPEGDPGFWTEEYAQGVRLVRAPMSPEQIGELVKLQDDAAHLPAKPKKGDPNMLSITTQARKLSLDVRLVNPNAPENPNGKIPTAAGIISDVYRRTTEADKRAGTVARGTTLVFLDLATPKTREKKKKKDAPEPWEMGFPEWAAFRGIDINDPLASEAYFSEILAAVESGETIPERVIAALPAPYDQAISDAIESRNQQGEQEGGATSEPETVDELHTRNQAYGILRKDLVARGIPLEEIAFVHDAKTSEQRKALFEKFNAGQIRVLVGSRQKMGVGVNIQQRIAALVHIDTPWRPDQVEQADGRGWRPGNLNTHLEIYRIVATGTGGAASPDAAMWQKLEFKAKQQAQLMRGKVIAVDTIEDIGGSIIFQAQEFIGAASNNPLAIEKANLENRLANLELLDRHEAAEKRAMKKELGEMRPEALAELEKTAAADAQDADQWDQHKQDPLIATIDGTEHAGQKEIDKALEAHSNKLPEGYSRLQVGQETKHAVFGTYRTFELLSVFQKIGLGPGDYRAFLSVRGPSGRILPAHSFTLLGINGITGEFRTRAIVAKGKIAAWTRRKEELERRIAQPSTHGDEIVKIRARLGEINQLMGGPAPQGGDDVEDDEDTDDDGDDADELLTPDEDDGYPGTVDQAYTSALMTGDRETMAQLTEERTRDYLEARSAPTAPVAAPPTSPPPTFSTAMGALIMRPDVMIQEMARVVRRLQGGGLILSGSGFRGKDGLHGYYVHAAPLHVAGGPARYGVGNIYLRRATDTDTAAHEIGHMIQDIYWGPAELSAYSAEIAAARKARLGVDVSPSGNQIEEGWAEFMALYLTQPARAQFVAPTLYAEFENRLEKPPGLQGSRYARQAENLARVFREFRRQYQLRSTGSYEQRLQSVMARQQRTGILGELSDRFQSSMDALSAAARAGNAALSRSEWIANVMMPVFQDTWDVLRRRVGGWRDASVTATFMANRPIRVAERTLDPKHKLEMERQADSPLIAARTMSPKATEAARVFLESGILDPDTGLVAGPSYHDILRTIDPDATLGQDGRDAFGQYLVARHILELERTGAFRIQNADQLKQQIDADVASGRLTEQDVQGSRIRVAGEKAAGERQIDQAKNLRAMTWSLTPGTKGSGRYAFLPPRRAQILDEVRDFVERVDLSKPNFTDAQKLWRQWNDGVLDYIEKAGGLPATDMRRIRETYSTVTWVPLQRVFADEARATQPETRGGGAKRPPFYQRGSGRTQRPLLDPMIAAPQNMYYAITAAERNKTLRTLVDLQNEYSTLDTAPLAGQFLETVAQPQMPVTPGPGWIRDQVKRAMKKAGASPQELAGLDHMDFSGADTLWVRSPRMGDIWPVSTPAGRTFIRFNDKMVEQVFTTLDAETLRSMVGMSVKLSNAFMRMYRWGTVHNPGFAVAAILKDQATAMYRHGTVMPWMRGIIPFLAEQPILATSAVSGLMGALGGGPMVGAISAGIGAALPIASRAAMSIPRMAQVVEALRAAKVGGGLVLGDRISFNDEGIQRWIREQDVSDNPANILRSPLTAGRKFLRQMNGVANLSDMPTRYGIAIALAQAPTGPKPAPTQDANERARLAISMRDGAMDWEQFGSRPFLRILAMMAPFLGANMTAFYQSLHRPTGQTRAQVAWRTGVYLASMAAIAGAAFWWEREDPRWREQARYLRSLYLPLIAQPKTHAELVAMTPEERASNSSQTFVLPLDPFGGAMVNIVRDMLEIYVDRPRHAEQRTAGGVLVGAAKDLLPAGGRPWMMAPLPVRAAAEITAGHIFFSDRPMTPVTLRGLAPEYQITERTTEAAKALGKVSRDVHRATGIGQLSPIEIDHLIYSFGGLMTSMSARGIERFVLENLTDKDFPRTPATRDIREAVPGWSRFLAAYPGLRHQSIQDYYDRRRVAEGYRDTWNAAIKAGDKGRLREIKADPEARFYVELSQVEAFMTISSQLAELNGEALLLRKKKNITEDTLRDKTDAIHMKRVDLAYRAVVVAEGLRRAQLEGK